MKSGFNGCKNMALFSEKFENELFYNLWYYTSRYKIKKIE